MFDPVSAVLAIGAAIFMGAGFAFREPVHEILWKQAGGRPSRICEQRRRDCARKGPKCYKNCSGSEEKVGL
ncbi:hypothetical protein BU23DRAFT_551529 [Bimuria novae-zelandiae CBS 107.79]|uniref:Uncharacterized protein n=1 Tax=Bimuria novae-zelandiae CBS 107.79 TaxID=1447943 RepID=A0A6A5VHA5_9PLEO|nr:hypothetical protein BU23DRAFT_551529 [Bimuria novae-zelandiae CBS 107.79]